MGTWGVGGSGTTGARVNCTSSNQSGCLWIRWPGQRTNVRHAIADTATIQNWFGGLVDGMRDASGQMYMRNRYYDPASGQFTQPDPIGLAGGLNAYGFANGDPVSYSDPYGLRADSVWVGVRRLDIPVLGAFVNHTSVRVDNVMYELTADGERSVVNIITVPGNSDLDRYNWYLVDTPEGKSDGEFSAEVSRNALALGGEVNRGQRYNPLGKNCNWYTSSVINASGALVPSGAAHDRGRESPGLCRNGACTRDEYQPMITH